MSYNVPDDVSHRAGFSVTAGRETKAYKIRAVIEAARGPLIDTDLVLDIGTGSGGIAAALARHATVFAADRIDQRMDKDGYVFLLSNESLPFPASTFDIVISNHVIEHVTNPELHLEEMRRVVKPFGVCYLATPNRWWPYEVHSRLAILHWLPPSWFNLLAKQMGRLAEGVRLESLASLARRGTGLFSLETWHDRVVLDPPRYALDLPRWARSAVSLLPQFVTRWSRGLHPTLMVILRPTQDEHSKE